MSGKVPKSEYRLADGSMYRSSCEIMELSDREAAITRKELMAEAEKRLLSANCAAFRRRIAMKL